MKKMYIFIILLIVIAGLVIWQISLQSKKEKYSPKSNNVLTNKQTFSCSRLKEISFDYTLSEEWEVDHIQEEKDGCKIYLKWEKSIIPSLPYIYVNKRAVDIFPNFTNSNPNKISYIRLVKKTPISGKDFLAQDEAEFFLPESIIKIGLELYSESGTKDSKPLNRDVFWNSVIESFKFTGQSPVQTQILKHYVNAQLGLNFDYPQSWNFVEDLQNDGGIVYVFTAPDGAAGGIGKKLEVIATTLTPWGSDSFTVPACPKGRQLGTLTINNQTYTRCNIGSGLYIFQIAFMEQYAKGNIYLQFNYNSLNPSSQDTKIIEGIIQSFKF